MSLYDGKHCPKCGTLTRQAGGIGDFCPNPNCSVSDNLENPDAAPITWHKDLPRADRVGFEAPRREPIPFAAGGFELGCAKNGNAIFSLYNSQEEVFATCELHWGNIPNFIPILQSYYDMALAESRDKDRLRFVAPRASVPDYEEGTPDEA